VIEDVLLEAIDKMERAVEHVQSQFSTVRTGRANAALVDRIVVEYYERGGRAEIALRSLSSS